ncbi:MAG: molybdopterin-dependent oxidoreductase [Pyrinomonadaceae bacterium]
MFIRTVFVVFTVLSAGLSAALGQGMPMTKPAVTATTAPAVLTVGGEVAKPLTLSPADLAKLPRQTVTVAGHDGKSSTLAGVSLIEILKQAGLELGDKLHGKSFAMFVVIEATDGYKVVLSLPEIDSGTMIIADQEDGKPLSQGEGPWKLVIASDKKPHRWARQVVSITVRRA